MPSRSSASATRSLAQLQRAARTNPNEIANRRWWATAFPDHPYGRPSNGTPETLAAITVDDLRSLCAQRVRARHADHRHRRRHRCRSRRQADRPRVRRLPAKATLAPVPDAAMQGLGERIVINLDVPQTVITFGGAGTRAHDPDFFAAYVVNHIFGGGSHTSRLYHEVREKRGLAYSASARA